MIRMRKCLCHLRRAAETVKFTPAKIPCATHRGVAAGGSKDGLVAASRYGLDDIGAMSASFGRGKAKEKKKKTCGRIKGVPYVMRMQGAEALAAYVKAPKAISNRFSLPCNTGPAGSGKTVLQRQNMMQVARDFGFLAVEIEFNAIQSVRVAIETDNFRRLVVNRILCYLPKYWKLDWGTYLEKVTEDFKGPMSVPEAVRVLKKALKHKGPVLLAVDELALVPGCGKANLTRLCQIMDESLGEPDSKKKDRIFVAVSVYDLADLGTFATKAKRKLVHQQLPPILPLLVDSDVTRGLPLWLQVFFNKQKREELMQKDAIETVATLLAESAGHPRRIEALIQTVDKISHQVQSRAQVVAKRKKKTPPSESELLDSQLQAVETEKEHCLVKMNEMLNLHAVGRRLSSFVELGPMEEVTMDMRDSSWRALVLLKYLFTTVDMDEVEAHVLWYATTLHYQLVPHVAGYVGYLPLPALQVFCRKQLYTCNNKEVMSYLEHAKGVADANLSAPRDSDEKSKSFEMGMFHALCGAVLARQCLTEDMFRRSPKELPETHCTEIEWAEDIDLFPNAVKETVEDGKTLSECDDETLQRILSVGAVNERDGRPKKSFAGLAFVPIDKWNMCCDFVLVLPTADTKRAGRVVFAVQCKDWAGDLVVGKGSHVLAHFRYGRHCFEADQVYLRKTNNEKKGPSKRYAHSWRLSVSRTACVIHRLPNTFQKKFCKLVEQNTRVVFVLATVNEVNLPNPPEIKENDDVHEIMQKFVKSVFGEVNLPADEKYRETALLEDEGLVDLQHMCGWCPTVGYGALLAEKLRFPLVSDNKENDKQAKAA